MFNLGPGEITVILLLALIFLGPKRLPELASGLGKIIRDIRKATSDVKNEIALDETFRKPFDELREAVTLHPDELKRRDQIREQLESVRKQAEEAERASQAVAAKGEPLASVPPPPIAPAPLVPPPIAPAVAAPADEAEPPKAGVSDSVAAALAAVEPPAPPPARSRARAHTPPPAPPPVVSGPETISFSSPSSDARASSNELHAASSELHGAAAEAPAPPPPPAPRAPAAPPPGTVSAPPTRIGPPRVTPPVSSLFGDAANKTQTLSEEDIMAAASSGPPPPPGAARKATPPPLPGLVKPPPPPAGAKKV